MTSTYTRSSTADGVEPAVFSHPEDQHPPTRPVAGGRTDRHSRDIRFSEPTTAGR
ncbi:hypothetical protein [Saccharopolyspora gloriosae]|uniref:hypothetical protein n=1 Tax=Saccharopolyspora gloriosae TaxID=455344 RepID=UPI001FB5FD4A|nr:hypothetical protein [Saccharopolyspora gloriosae]